jgi:hypothetical protein
VVLPTAIMPTRKSRSVTSSLEASFVSSRYILLDASVTDLRFQYAEEWTF